MLLNKSDGDARLHVLRRGRVQDAEQLDVLEIQDLIGSARGGLRRAAWGDEEDWREDRDYL